MVQVSWITGEPVPLPAIGQFSAVPGSPLTQPGAIVLGSPLQLLGAAPLQQRIPFSAAVGWALRQWPSSAVPGTPLTQPGAIVLGSPFGVAVTSQRLIPFSAILLELERPTPPIYTGGGRIPPQRAPREGHPARYPMPRPRRPVRALSMRVRVTGLVGQVEARVEVAAPVALAARALLLLPRTRARLRSSRPLSVELALLRQSGSVRARVKRIPVQHVRVRPRGWIGDLIAQARVVAPIASRVEAKAVPSFARAVLSIDEPLRYERQQLWILGLAELEDLLSEADDRELAPI